MPRLEQELIIFFAPRQLGIQKTFKSWLRCRDTSVDGFRYSVSSHISKDWDQTIPSLNPHATRNRPLSDNIFYLFVPATSLVPFKVFFKLTNTMIPSSFHFPQSADLKVTYSFLVQPRAFDALYPLTFFQCPQHPHFLSLSLSCTSTLVF